MLKHIYQGGVIATIMTLTACSADTLPEEILTPGNTPIQLLGTTTRGSSSSSTTETSLNGYSGLKLSAKYNNTFYFENKDITVTATASGETKNKLSANAYYPLGDTKIKLFGHTGSVDKDGNLTLTSGTEPSKDILISNGTDGTGTEGGSGTDGQAQLLTFRHAMTKVTVKMEIVDDAGIKVEDTKPTEMKIGFDNSTVAQTGKYALTGTTADAATSISGSCILTGATGVGTVNYLVPTGKTLSSTENSFITSLKIDDYTATADDCKLLFLPQAELNGVKSDFILTPGLAYTLTFKINRLKVVEVNLTMKPWDIETGDGSWGCDPYKVTMNFSGGYNNTDANAISKMVFHYTPQSSSNSYQYIASVKDGIAEFLTLPTDMTKGILTADLYTANGLLIQDHTITYAAGAGSDPQKFNLSLGANGMVKGDDGYYEVGTPLQFYNMMTNPGTDAEAVANKQYKLIKNIDISHLPLSFTPPTFPTDAILDGDGHSILHLELKGNGLFAENKGTLRNLQLSFSSIEATTGTYAGSICAVNNGKIEGCINEADVITTDNQIAGGICGQNNGTILACLNTGNVPNGAEIGGICGENKNTGADAIKACINAGMLHGSSNHGITSNIGGICGYQSETSNNAVINTCYWLTGTARPVQGNSQEMAIGRFADGTADGSKAAYCNNTTNMIENKLRTEGKDNLNNGLGTSSNWEFKWETNSNGTYKTVWPTPVKKVNP